MLYGSARVHLQRSIQLGAAKVQETLCIGAFGARVLIKELVLDINGRPRDLPLKSN